MTQTKELGLLLKSHKSQSCQRETKAGIIVAMYQLIFSFIPIDCVIIDMFHLFQRGADVLINLLIRDLRILDGIEKAVKTLPDREKHKNRRQYEDLLNGPYLNGILTIQINLHIVT